MSEAATPDDPEADARAAELPGDRRAAVIASVVLALLAYLPALTAAPGRMPSDSKLYLYLDPGRFFVDAASSFDPRQFAGWVPHQHIAYLWPGLPWFWTFETLGVPDWIAHRLWIGTIMLVAGLGARRLARVLGLGPSAALAAALVYQLTLFVIPYVSRTSVLLLPWAGLGWIVAFTIRATRRGGWADPAAVALIVVTVGAVNATALAMIVPGPVLWLVHAAWQRSVTWRGAAAVALRTGVLCAGVSTWWVVMLVIQSRSGTDVLPYSESLADVSLTATAPETWRSLGYWLFYVRDPFAAATTESLRYLTSSLSIALSYAVPVAALTSLTYVAWSHRRYAAMLIGTGLVLAVGVHPIDDRSPLMRFLAGDDESGLALALRSSTRALPLVALGSALALAAAVDAAGRIEWGVRWLTPRRVAAGSVGLLAVANLPALWTGGFVDPALERDESPPAAWTDAAAALDARNEGGRVLQLPGAEFGAFRWGYTVDQPLPGLIDQPLVTRDLLPLGSAAAMDLVFALDDRLQDGTLEAESLAPIAQMLGVEDIWLANDLAFDRFRTARPEVVRDLVEGAPGIGAVSGSGEPVVNQPVVAMRDEREIADARVGAALPEVELAAIDEPVGLVRARDEVVLVAGSGAGLVDAAAAGLLDPTRTVVRYTADLDDAGTARSGATAVIVTDSNRDRARHWRSSQDSSGFTEPGGQEPGVLRPVSSDARLPVFASDDPATQTVATQEGPVVATATSYGEPFAYLPEHRPYAAIDGNPTTAWLVGEHADPIGEMLRLSFDRPVDRVAVVQPDSGAGRSITAVSYVGRLGDETVSGDMLLDERSRQTTGQELALPSPVTTLELTIASVGGGVPFTAGAVAPVGFAEIRHDLGDTVEVTRVPVDVAADPETPLAFVFSRSRTDPMNRWRDDPEPVLVRSFETSSERAFDVDLTVRVDARATDTELAALFEWPVVASTRLAGAPGHAGVAAFDGDPATAWTTAFGEAAGATVTTTSERPVDRIVVHQPGEGFSSVVQLTVRGDGETRVVDLVPLDDGTMAGVVDPVLPPGPVEIELSGVVETTTVDRRFGDTVVLPAAIGELEFDGRPVVDLDGRPGGVLARCRPVLDLDGTVVSATLAARDGGWIDGEPLDVTPCEPTIELGAGTHLLTSRSGELPVFVDRVVLDDGVRPRMDALSESERTPTTEITDDGRFQRSVRVEGCPDGCWLVFGEGFNEAWSATVDGRDLGAPELVDGGFNGWWIEASADAVTVELTWTHQRTLLVALALSALAVAICVALVAVGRRRPETVAERTPQPRFDGDRVATRGSTLAAAIAWPVAAGLVVGPTWALWGLAGGALVLLRPRHRWPELVATATVAVVGLAVVIRERRHAPPPGGGWPGEFADLHGIAMFAVACVIVAAIGADDATATRTDPEDTDEDASIGTLADDAHLDA